jgi:hypothetical protein
MTAARLENVRWNLAAWSDDSTTDSLNPKKSGRPLPAHCGPTVFAKSGNSRARSAICSLDLARTRVERRHNTRDLLNVTTFIRSNSFRTELGVTSPPYSLTSAENERRSPRSGSLAGAPLLSQNRGSSLQPRNTRNALCSLTSPKRAAGAPFSSFTIAVTSFRVRPVMTDRREAFIRTPGGAT